MAGAVPVATDPQTVVDQALAAFQAELGPIAELWNTLQRAILRGARPDPVSTARDPILERIAVARAAHRSAREQVAGSAHAVELDVQWTEWEYHVQEIVSLQRYLGERYDGATLRSHLADDLTSHCAIVAVDALLVSEAMADIREARSLSQARRAFRSTDYRAQARLFLIECLQRTNHLMLRWAGEDALTMANAWEALYPAGHEEAEDQDTLSRVDIRAEARENARAEHSGVDSSRIDVIDQLVEIATAIASGELEATPRRYDGISNALRSDEEVRLFMRRLNAGSIGARPLYDCFLNLAPEAWAAGMCRRAGTQPPVPDPTYTEAFIEEAVRRAAELAGLDPDEFFEKFNIRAAIRAIHDEPDRFVQGLFEAARLGCENFVDRFLSVHLPGALGRWIESRLGELDITLPDDPLSTSGLVSIALQVLGLGPDQLRERAEEHLGAEGVAFLEAALEDGLEGVLGYAGELVEQVKDQIIDEITSALYEQAIRVGAQVLTGLLGAGPAGALIAAIRTAWSIYQELSSRAEQLIGLIEGAARLINQIMANELGPAATAVESMLADLLDIVIGILARWAGIDRVVDVVEGAVNALRGRVSGVIDSVIASIGALFTGGDEGEADPAAAETEGQADDDPRIGEEIAVHGGARPRQTWLAVEGNQVEAKVSGPETTVERKLAEWNDGLEALPEALRPEADADIDEALGHMNSAELHGTEVLRQARAGGEQAGGLAARSNTAAVEAQRALAEVLGRLFGAFEASEEPEIDYAQLLAPLYSADDRAHLPVVVAPREFGGSLPPIAEPAASSTDPQANVITAEMAAVPSVRRPSINDTGMRGAVSRSAFVDAALELVRTWDAFASPEARGLEMGREANSSLAVAGVPPTLLLIHAIGSGPLGSFVASDWTLELSTALFDGAAPAPTGGAETLRYQHVADVPYHEAVHADQAWRIACALATMFWTPEAINGELARQAYPGHSISEAVLREALIEQHGASPVRLDPVVQSWFDSIFTRDGGDLRQRRIQAAVAAGDAFRAAHAELLAAQQRGAPAAEVQQKVRALEQARATSDSAMQAYKALPEEADAFGVSDQIAAEFISRYPEIVTP